MEIRWSTLAAEDLERIFQRIEKDNPTAARETVQAIYDGCRALKDFPHRGRPGRMNGRRELVFARTSPSIRSRRTPLKSPASITARRTGLRILPARLHSVRWKSVKETPRPRFTIPSTGNCMRGFLSSVKIYHAAMMGHSRVPTLFGPPHGGVWSVRPPVDRCE